MVLKRDGLIIVVNFLLFIIIKNYDMQDYRREYIFVK
jgi:hypothetical protein